MHADHHGGSQSPCWWRRMHPSKFILATARIRQHMPNVWFKIYNHPCVLQAPTSNLRRHFFWNCKGRIPGFLASCSRFIPCLLDCFLACLFHLVSSLLLPFLHPCLLPCWRTTQCQEERGKKKGNLRARQPSRERVHNVPGPFVQQ